MRGLALAATVVLVVLASLGPVAWLALTSLKGPARIAARPPTLVPDFDLGSYRAAFGRHQLLRYVRNSAVVAGSTTVLAVGLGVLAAYPLARLRLRHHRGILLLVLAASMFPQIALAGGVYRLVASLGLLNTYAGLVLPYSALALPLAIWILASFFHELPSELEDAARVDGATVLGTLRHVVLPLAAPGVATAAILVFLQTWNEFFFALLITTDPKVATLPVGIAKFPGEHLVPWGELSAAAVVAIVPLVAVVLVLERRIVSGLTAGAVKG